MAMLKSGRSLAGGRVQTVGVEYRGKQTRTGNSLGFRFEGALFKSHPEFNGEVRAHIIAPGRMLVTAETESREKADPVMEAFLAFLAKDMEDHPENIKPLSASRAKRIAELTKGVVVDLDEDLGDEALL
ncbi:MAG: type II toxin-antitoxin system PrlF family antitoxin [Terracidiphilus sp.]|jgi:antitoxin PrlF